MGLFNNPYIFQENIPKLLKEFDIVREYKDNVLFITNKEVIYQLKDIENVLHNILEAELMLNTEKIFFG